MEKSISRSIRVALCSAILLSSAAVANASGDLFEKLYSGAKIQDAGQQADAMLSQATPMSDPNFEWSQFEEKEVKAELKGDKLVIESRKDNKGTWSSAEFPIDVQGDNFKVTLTGTYDKAENEKQFGIIFDIKNDRNYKLIIFGKKQFSYMVCENGELSTVKRSLVKLPKSKLVSISIEKIGSTVDVYLNDAEVTKLKNIDMNYPTFGFYVCGKNKFIAQGFSYQIAEAEETEQSTTD